MNQLNTNNTYYNDRQNSQKSCRKIYLNSQTSWYGLATVTSSRLTGLSTLKFTSAANPVWDQMNHEISDALNTDSCLVSDEKCATYLVRWRLPAYLVLHVTIEHWGRPFNYSQGMFYLYLNFPHSHAVNTSFSITGSLAHWWSYKP